MLRLHGLWPSGFPTRRFAGSQGLPVFEEAQFNQEKALPEVPIWILGSRLLYEATLAESFALENFYELLVWETSIYVLIAHVRGCMYVDEMFVSIMPLFLSFFCS